MKARLAATPVATAPSSVAQNRATKLRSRSVSNISPNRRRSEKGSRSDGWLKVGMR